jgi:hypothetical protein
MSDDLDDLDAALRRAMATLDGEAPPGYFEALPERTLARLDDPELGSAVTLVAPGDPVGPVDEAPASAAASMASAGPLERRWSRRARAAIVGIGLAAAVAAIYLAGNAGVRREPSIVADSERTVAASSPAAPGDAAAAPAIASGAGSSAGSGVASDIVQGSASRAASEPVGKLAGSVAKRPIKVKAPDDRPGASGKKLSSDKPRPDGPPPSRDDVERALAAVAGKARACAGGTPGTVSLRLTVAPSGRIAQVTVTGPFAGTPAGACVERAVRTATFPPWDGAPQSFDYSYLRSD